MVKEAVIVAGARTAVGRAPRGTLRTTRPDDMAAAVLGEVVRRAEGLDPAEIEDVAIGVKPCSRAKSADVTITAAAPSLVCDELPAVTVPCV